MLICAKGIEPKIVEHLENPPSAAEIRVRLKEMGIGPRALFRPKWTDSELIAAMAQYPVLIERPVVRTRRGTRLCRPPDRLKDIL